MTERGDGDGDEQMRGDVPDPPEPFDPSDPGRPFMPPDLQEEMGGSLDLDADLEEARFLEDERRERRHEAVSMDTSTFMAIPAPTPSIPFIPPEFDEKEGRLGRSTAFFSIATAFSRVAGLVREIVAASYFGITGPMSAFTIAFQVPNLVAVAVRRRRDPGRLRPGLHRGAREGQQAGGVPARLDADLHGHPGARGDHGALHSARAGHHADLRARVQRRDPRPDGHALADPLPDPDPAGRDRDGGGGPEQLRPVRGVRDLAVLLERRDHPRAGPAGAGVPRQQPDLRVRDRRAGRDRGPARRSRRGTCATHPSG